MMERSHSFIAIPPGVTIKEQLDDRKLTQKEFSARMGMSEKHISRLINGDVQLTPDVALRLEMVLGVPAKFWNNLEAIYREKLTKIKAENEMDEDIELIKKIPYIEMVKNGWLEKTTNSVEKVFNLRKFFEVANLSLLHNPQVMGLVCRRLLETEKSNYVLLTLVQRAKIEARDINTNNIDLKTLQSRLPMIRSMTMWDPIEFYPKLLELLADCGIALVLLPHLEGSYLHGVTFYDGKKIVLGLTVRGRDADKFWFSLFHEFGHILHGHIGMENGSTSEVEMVADKFACDSLIPLEDFEKFVNNGLRYGWTNELILEFAKSINIHQGIIVGRLQKEGKINYSQFNNLKVKYKLS